MNLEILWNYSYTVHLNRDMSLLESTFCFPAGKNTETTATSWTGALPDSKANSVPQL
jgi:hypothetical protein